MSPLENRQQKGYNLKVKIKYSTDNLANISVRTVSTPKCVKSLFLFMWADLSKKNRSKPDLVFTCSRSMEEVLHSDLHGRNCISTAHRA